MDVKKGRVVKEILKLVEEKNMELVSYEDVKNKMVEHHTKYKEIHGEDKTVFMPIREHTALHRRLRKEGKCNIPVNKSANIVR